MLQGHYKQSLDLLDFTLPDPLRDSEVQAQKCMTQSADSAFLFQTEAAHKYFNDASRIIRTTQPNLLGDLTILEGTLSFLAGDSQKAYDKYLAARDIAKRNKDAFLESAALGSLGLAATGLERYDESVDWNKQALELSQLIGARNSIGRIQGNIGWSYHELGDLENALYQFELAETEAARTGNISDQSYWLNSEANVLYDLHAYAKANPISRKALQLARSLNDMRTLIECLQIHALIAIARSDFSEAQDNLEEAFRLQSAAPDPKRDLYTVLLSADLSVKTGNLNKAEASYMQIASDSHAPTSLRWEALARLAQVHAGQGKIELAGKEFAQSIDTISKAQDAIGNEDSRLSFLTASINFYDQYVNFFLSQNESIRALGIADRSRAQTLEHGLSTMGKGRISSSLGLTPRELSIRQNATLLFYWLGEERSILWVANREKVSTLTLPSRSEIAAIVAKYRESFLGSQDPLENQQGRRLYEILVRPAEKLIPKNSRVVILPDRELAGLNFETLIVPDTQPHFWIEDVTVSVAYSLSLLSRSKREPPPKAPNLLFFGDALQANKDFPPLADAGQEAQSLSEKFPETRRKLFSGAQATRSNYLSSSPSRYSYIHFSTHGTASIAHPLESAIILSPEGDTYKLYARDIVQQPLNAYLVSISACDGAGNRVLAGEGLVGLAWAFLRAGAHNVVAGLWEVSTASAPKVFNDLYDGVLKGEDPATALRQAKLNLIHSKGPSSRPFYWAPFQLYLGS
jgi:CHAT domain-containing protein